MKEMNCYACEKKTPTHGPRICPECGHTFASRHNNWDGIDAHWKNKHEHVMPYREFFDNLCDAHRKERARRKS